MSKYRRGIAYLRPIKKGDKANSYMVAIKNGCTHNSRALEWLASYQTTCSGTARC